MEEKDPQKPRLEKCRECGLVWNISVLAEIPKNGYLCPRCWSRHKKV